MLKILNRLIRFQQMVKNNYLFIFVFTLLSISKHVQIIFTPFLALISSLNNEYTLIFKILYIYSSSSFILHNKFKHSLLFLQPIILLTLNLYFKSTQYISIHNIINLYFILHYYIFITMKILICFFIIQIITSAILLFIIPNLSNINQPIYITFWILTLLALIFYFIVHFKDPGYLSYQEQPLNKVNVVSTTQVPKIIEMKQQLDFSIKIQNISNEQNQQNHQQQLKIQDFVIPSKSKSQLSEKTEVSGQIQKTQSNSYQNNILKIQKKYCRFCHIDQPYRTKHCIQCQKCVMTFDHHCPWIQNCVGQKNRPIFYIYLLIQLSQIAYAQFLVVYNFQLSNIRYDLIVIFSILLIMLVMIGSLFIFHTYLMIRNITTWQLISWQKISYLSGRRRDKNPFNYGICENIRRYYSSAFIKNPVDWKFLENE